MIDPALGSPNGVATHEPPIANARLAMMLFVASEAMLFTGLVAGYVVLGYGSRGFEGMPVLPLGLAPYATAVLAASSGALVAAGRAIAAGRASASRWSLATLALGTLFLGLQALEWMRMVGDGLLPESGVNSGMLYVIGGVHGLHVAGGLVFLGILAVRAMRAPRDARTRSFATTAALYWHFVTLVWLTLFLMLYVL